MVFSVLPILTVVLPEFAVIDETAPVPSTVKVAVPFVRLKVLSPTIVIVSSELLTSVTLVLLVALVASIVIPPKVYL